MPSAAMQGQKRSVVVAVSLLAFLVGGAEARCPAMSTAGAPKRQLMGGQSAPKAIDDDVQEVFAEAQADHHLLLSRQKQGENIAVQQVKLCYYTSQVVAGINYYVTVSTDENSDTYYEVQIFRPLPYTHKAASVEGISFHNAPATPNTRGLSARGGRYQEVLM
eukprot:TRINITY_DN111306_c0_g1_i1.p1 TRINITY_DN111306_c0_g1~~TRINITY_DN111306_c0_g1_i1.p1  ORF type:complete len:163 (+),score=28.26 TRINITY_DN111306_c0_g1_i1:90-578(+)